MESGYYNVYGQNNVKLVDLNESPIEKITARGIKTKDKEYELDLIVYAIGFDAITGAFNKLKITGEDSIKLNDKWATGPTTYLDITSAGSPIFFTLLAHIMLPVFAIFLAVSNRMLNGLSIA